MKSIRQKKIEQALRHFKATLDVRMTPSEVMFKEWFDKTFHGSSNVYESQAIFINEQTLKGYVIDFYLPRISTAIEIDGGYHDTEEQRQKDAVKDKFLKSIGVDVVRIKNEQVKDKSFQQTIINLFKTKLNVDDETLFSEVTYRKKYWE